MERLLECSVCLDRYNSSDRKPLILPCGHTVCQGCCQTHIARERFCPMCRQPLNNRLEDLQVNYALMFDLQPTTTGSNSLQPQQREQLRGAVNQLLASLEGEKAAVASVQLQWRALRQDHQSTRLRLCSTLETAAKSLQEAANTYHKELSALDEANETQMQRELQQWDERLQAKLQAVNELTAMLAEKSPFSAERVVEAETQLARQGAGPAVTVRTVGVPQDLGTKVAALVEEVTRAVSTGVMQLMARKEAEAPNPMMSSMSSIASVGSGSGRGRGGRREHEPKPERAVRPERAERPRKDRPDRNPAVAPADIPQRGGPSQGAKWCWLKNDNSLKPFNPEDIQALEQAFQAGAQQHTLINLKTGDVNFVVDFEHFLSFKGGKGKPRPVQRILE